MAVEVLSNYSFDYDADLEDPFKNEQESDAERYYRLMRSISVFNMVAEIIKIILVFVVIIVDVYLIVIICRNKNLRSVKSNRYIMHYAIFNILVFLTVPTFVVAVTVLRAYSLFGWWTYCIEIQLETTTITCMFFCTFGLALDWLLTVYCTNVKPIILKIYNYSILIIYVFGIFKTIVDTSLCRHNHHALINIIEQITYLIVIIFIGFCNVKSKSVKHKKSYSLTTASIMALCWLPLYICHNLHEWFFYTYTFRFIIQIIIFIPAYLAFGSPIIVVMWLGKINKFFCIAYRKSFSCCTCCKAISNYSGDDESFEDSESIEDGKNAVNVDTSANNTVLL